MAEPRELPEHLKKSRRSRLPHLAAEFGTVDKIPVNFVSAKSEDGKTVVLLDGTKVTDESLASALDVALKADKPDPEILALTKRPSAGDDGKGKGK
jgi:hypothetical protein